MLTKAIKPRYNSLPRQKIEFFLKQEIFLLIHLRLKLGAFIFYFGKVGGAK
jgi:hypothetical protein